MLVESLRKQNFRAITPFDKAVFAGVLEVICNNQPTATLPQSSSE